MKYLLPLLLAATAVIAVLIFSQAAVTASKLRPLCDLTGAQIEKLGKELKDSSDQGEKSEHLDDAKKALLRVHDLGRSNLHAIQNQSIIVAALASVAFVISLFGIRKPHLPPHRMRD